MVLMEIKTEFSKGKKSSHNTAENEIFKISKKRRLDIKIPTKTLNNGKRQVH